MLELELKRQKNYSTENLKGTKEIPRVASSSRTVK
jgi:hypothetical protein